MNRGTRSVAAPGLALVLVAVGVAACSSSSGDASGPGTAPGTACEEGSPGCLGWQSCPPELAPDPGGAGCREIVPDAACPAGTTALLGEATCQPIGPAACAKGFAPAASGWGCDVVLPKAACAGATRGAIGSDACAPVGDCNAPFPPPEATLFVSAAYTDAEIDQAHFKTIDAAALAAKPGAVIAVDSGTYAEGIVAYRSITVVGRCAEKVHLVGTGKDVPGVYANATKNVTVRGFTFEDHFQGVRAQAGGTVTITDSVFEAPRLAGLIAYEPGSAVHAERVVVRGVKRQPNAGALPMGANADGGGTVEVLDSELFGSWAAGAAATNPEDPKHTSTLHLERVVVRDSNADLHAQSGAGVIASGHSRAEVIESAVVNTRGIAVAAFDAPAVTHVERSVVRTTEEDASGVPPAAAYAATSGTVELVDTTIRDAAQAGLYADGPSTITMTGGVIESTRPGSDGDFGMGAWTDRGGALDVENTAIVDAAYYGVGVNAPKSTAKLARVLVQGTMTSRKGVLGRGVNVEAGATATLDRVTLIANHDTSLFVRGQDKSGARAEVTATRLLVLDPASLPDGTLGVGASVERGGKLTIDTAAVLRAKQAGVTLNELKGDAGAISEASLTHVIVRDTQGSPKVDANTTSFLGGAGIVSGGVLTVQSSAVVNSLDFGVIVGDPTGSLTLQSSYVGGTKPGPTGEYGHGVVAIGTPSVSLRNAVVRDNVVGLAFKSSAGLVSDVLVANNTIGIHVEGDGFALTTAPKAPDAPPPDAVVVTDDTRFVDNATKVGDGAVPLPEALFPSP